MIPNLYASIVICEAKAKQRVVATMNSFQLRICNQELQARGSDLLKRTCNGKNYQLTFSVEPINEPL